MSAVATGFRSFRILLEMVKIEHSVFALPFAMIGMMWGAKGWPGWWVFGWIVAAMVSCRSASMAFNRILDRDIDAQNDRTKMRALPAGLLRLRQANLFFATCVVVFLVSAAMLNGLALALSPVALLVTLGYSATKRFTPLCHFVLGLSLGIAPAAAWIGATGRLGLAAGALTLAVTFWTAGFDIIYALPDETFDLEHGLRSLPQTLGPAKALVVSRYCHVAAPAFLVVAGWMVGAGPLFFVGVAFAACLLAYEQSLVKPQDLSKVGVAFFNLNGYISVGLFCFALVDRLVAKPPA
jgi:4-hydroxybenzoate polyprenyltransferase